MLKIDTETMLIELTRGDSASIVFSAVDGDGTTWNPSEGDESLQFAVAKKWGGDPLMRIVNTFDPNDASGLEKFWTIEITTDDWLDDNDNDKFKFSDYVWDCQVLTSTGAQTIIGKIDDLEPTFRVLGEVAEE